MSVISKRRNAQILLTDTALANFGIMTDDELQNLTNVVLSIRANVKVLIGENLDDGCSRVWL